MSTPFGDDIKKSSRPLCDHAGYEPLSFEICCLPCRSGNARTYTSYLPDSLDMYAIHRPSGENVGALPLKEVWRNNSGLPIRSPELPVSTGTVQISVTFAGLSSINASRLPLRVKDEG